MRRITGYAIVLMLFAMTGCASKHMSRVGNELQTYTADDTTAVVIFMRPSNLSTFVNVELYESHSDEIGYVGVLGINEKVAHVVQPGKHEFMAYGSFAADFIEAELDAGKTYYVLVKPHISGMLSYNPKYWFTLHPISKEASQTEEIQGWYSECEFVEKTTEGTSWFSQYSSNVRQTFDSRYPEWNKKLKSDKEFIDSKSGVPF